MSNQITLVFDNEEDAMEAFKKLSLRTSLVICEPTTEKTMNLSDADEKTKTLSFDKGVRKVKRLRL